MKLFTNGDGRHWAAAQNFPQTVKYLMGNGAEIDVTDKHGDTPLCLAMAVRDKAGNFVDTLKACQVLGAQPNNV